MRPNMHTRPVLRTTFLALAGLLAIVHPSLADDWPQWLGPQRDGVWRETGLLEEFPAGGPVVRWRTSIGAGYAGPAVAKGRVYVADRRLAEGTRNPGNPFERGLIPGTERVLCLDEASGKILWQHEYDCPYSVSYPAGPRATPVVQGGKVYTLGAEGDLVCLDAVAGKVVWSRQFKKDYGIPTPVWGFAGHPLLEGNKLICLAGGQGSTAVAFDRNTGQELWRALTAKEPGYCPPMIYEAGGKRQLIIWHPESVNSLDPETGQVYWTEPFNVRSGLTIPTPRQLNANLFLTTFYNGSMMLRLDVAKPAATVVWQSKKASEKDTTELHSIMCTPFLEDGFIYGVCSYGQLRCLKAETGERVWETLAATTSEGKETRWANAFLIKNGRRFFLFNEKGDLIIAQLTPEGYREISRAHVLEPTNSDPGRAVVWSHPAFANGSIYARNDKEIICVSLQAAGQQGVSR
ncbi:MAG: PQQ-like beta-propeller repeat protein [Chloroflexi bacterium]|nr:PQQ-like beta-propeller repeat protein [Chloroflexota bacterium]